MRYAIYFSEDATSPLMQLGNTWLGRDPFTGKSLVQPSIDSFRKDRLHILTESPRRYGFHGTLKAPFFLRQDTSEEALLTACSAFGGQTAPFVLEGLSVNPLGKFLALTPAQNEPDLNAFAGLCVKHFEPFRAPLSTADLERRRASALTPRQDAYLTKWGYPYVFDEFRFHMTLSGKLEDENEMQRLQEAAIHHFKDVCARPRMISTFGLYAEAERGAPFKVHTIFHLSGKQAPASAVFNDRGHP